MTIQLANCDADLVDRSRKELWHAVLPRLLQERQTLGRLSNKTVREVAAAMGVSERHVRRKVAEVEVLGCSLRDSWVATPEHLTLLNVMGSVSGAYRELGKLTRIPVVDGKPISEQTFRRGLMRLDGFAYMAAVHGDEWVKYNSPTAGIVAAYRNHIWSIDDSLLPIYLKDAHGNAFKPWGQFLTDVCHRMMMALTVVPWTPTETDTRATLLAGIAPRRVMVDGQWFTVGGRPDILWSDNAANFNSDLLTVCLLGEVHRMFSAPHTPQHNAILERLIGVFKETLLQDLYGYIPKQMPGQSMVLPQYDTDRLLTLDEFQVIVTDRVRRYNEEHVHGSLDGLTPLQSYLADPTPITWVHEADLAALMMYSSTPKVRRSSVQVFTGVWTHPKLAALNGKNVEVRAIDKDSPQFIDVLSDGHHVCRIWAPSVRSEEENDDIRRAGRESRRIIRGNMRETVALRAEMTKQALEAAAAIDPLDVLAAEADTIAAEAGTIAALQTTTGLHDPEPGDADDQSADDADRSVAEQDNDQTETQAPDDVSDVDESRGSVRTRKRPGDAVRAMYAATPIEPATGGFALPDIDEMWG